MIQDKIEDMLREIWEKGKVPSKIVISHDTLNKWEEESGIPFILKPNIFLSSGWLDIPIETDDKVENKIIIKKE